MKIKAPDYTSRAYWEEYYRDSLVTAEQIQRICGYYDKYWERLIRVCARRPASIIEIGAYPGRYIAYLASRFQLRATALDYNSDRTKIATAFAAMNVADFDVLQVNVFEHEPAHQYDIVFSNGFIEHFDNFHEALDIHCRYLAPGGALMVMIPNKRYLRRLYGWLVDYANLKAHNLRCMRLRTFRDFAQRNNLTIHCLEYCGGFPYHVHQKLNSGQAVLFQAVRRTFKVLNPVIERHPNRFLSAAIIAIMTRAPQAVGQTPLAENS